MLVDKQKELMSDLFFTVHQHGGDDVTWKAPIDLTQRFLLLKRKVESWERLRRLEMTSASVKEQMRLSRFADRLFSLKRSSSVARQARRLDRPTFLDMASQKQTCPYLLQATPVNKIYLFSFQQKNVRNTTVVKIHSTQKPSRVVVTLGNTGDFHSAKDSSSNFTLTKLSSSSSLDFNLFELMFLWWQKGRKEFFRMQLQRLETIITIL